MISVFLSTVPNGVTFGELPDTAWSRSITGVNWNEENPLMSLQNTFQQFNAHFFSNYFGDLDIILGVICILNHRCYDVTLHLQSLTQ